MSLDGDDLTFFEQRFRDPHHLVLLVRPYATKASTAGGGMVVQPSDEAEASIEGDPAARMLFLWGRRPGDPGRLRSNVSREGLVTLTGLLQGF